MLAEVIPVAYGFDPGPFPPTSEFVVLKIKKWGGLKVDANQMTSGPGVFSGDVASRGPSLVVHAVRNGRDAARDIDRWRARMPTRWRLALGDYVRSNLPAMASCDLTPVRPPRR